MIITKLKLLEDSQQVPKIRNSLARWRAWFEKGTNPLYQPFKTFDCCNRRKGGSLPCSKIWKCKSNAKCLQLKRRWMSCGTRKKTMKCGTWILTTACWVIQKWIMCETSVTSERSPMSRIPAWETRREGRRIQCTQNFPCVERAPELLWKDDSVAAAIHETKSRSI